jgi:predicted Kef-type K+ transport protein
LLLPEGAIKGACFASSRGARSTAVSGEIWTTLGLTSAKIAAFIALMLIVGRRLLPRLLLAGRQAVGESLSLLRSTPENGRFSGRW